MSSIREELLNATRIYDDWRNLNLAKKSMHVAITNEPFLSLILNGTKTIESRFSLHRIAPFNRVSPGSVVFLKAGAVVGCFTVGWVKYFDLVEVPIDRLRDLYGPQICGDTSFWNEKIGKRYATLIDIAKAHPLTPLTISKTDRRAWLSLG